MTDDKHEFMLQKKIRSIQDSDRNELRERNKEYDRINSIQAEVTKFLARKIDTQLKEVEEKLESAERLANKFKSERTAIEAEMAKIKEDVIANDTRKRDLTDNFTMRQKEIDSGTLKAECDRLKEKLTGIDYETISRERKTLCERRDNTEREVMKQPFINDEIYSNLKER